jgi:hypothetical protein
LQLRPHQPNRALKGKFSTWCHSERRTPEESAFRFCFSVLLSSRAKQPLIFRRAFFAREAAQRAFCAPAASTGSRDRGNTARRQLRSASSPPKSSALLPNPIARHNLRRNRRTKI